MGCCSSRCVDDDLIEPNERTRLLNDENINDDNNQNFHLISQQREQEKLSQIVQKTAENLIDISNIRTVDQLQQQDIIERTKEYQEIIVKCENQNNDIKERINKLPAISNNNKNFFDNVNGFATIVNSSIKNEDKSQISNIINEIQDSLNDIKIEDVGEFVITFE
jgi:vacuolar-type H+-ATPase subunit I/STV1